MTLYSGTILLTELMMLAMIIHVMNYSGFTKDEKAWYEIIREESATHFDPKLAEVFMKYWELPVGPNPQSPIPNPHGFKVYKYLK